MAGTLSQPGCHTNTGTSSRGGRSTVKLEDNFVPLRAMRGSIRKVEKKLKKGKKILGRQSSFLQFSAKPVKISVKTDRERVKIALKKFEELRRHRSSLKCAQVLKEMNEKYSHLLPIRYHDRENHIPGVEVGDCFRWRAELCLVGLHRRPQAGIDWKDIDRDGGHRTSIAVSVVVSGGYEDDVDEGETLTYTGEGGNDFNRTKRQFENQKLEGGNLALYNSYILKNSVRVIRGRPDTSSPSGTLYSYDGLHKVVDCRKERGISNFEVFKFKLVREHGQKPLRWNAPIVSPRAKESGSGSSWL